MSAKYEYDVAILGWWYGANYGSMTTYFGLHQAISSLGYSVLMVHEPLGYNGYRVKWPHDLLSMKFADRMGYEYTNQFHFSELPHLNDKVNTFVVGSDQLWNPMIGRVNDDLFLDFVSDKNGRVAYATSFGNKGTKKFDGEFGEKHSKNLQKFDAISVREEYAVDIARDVFGVEADKVVDPVFLLEKAEYERLADSANWQPEGDYLNVFYLDPTPEKRRVAETVADKLGLSKIVIIPNPDKGRALSMEIFSGDRFEYVPEDAVENFLAAYKNANYVITDSFHGTAFSIIFERPFSSIYNTKRGADRFVNILKHFKFGESRRLYETDDATTVAQNSNVSTTLDFTAASDVLKADRESSMAWLKDTLATTVARVQSGAARTGIGASEQSQKHFSPPSDSATIIEAPEFHPSSNAWKVTKTHSETSITVIPGGSVKGNRVWCDLPQPLVKGRPYRLTFDWAPNTNARAINIHLRNSRTGTFKVIGTLPGGRKGNREQNFIDFIVPQDDFSQVMLGAVHFVGANPGARFYKIVLDPINKEDMTRPQQIKGPTPAEKVKRLSEADSDRYIRFYAKNMVSQSEGNERAVIMFNAHAVEKGLSRTNFRPGFGKIAIPKLAAEMNRWLDSGKSADDSFFKIGAAVMQAYFERHKLLDYNVSEFKALFKPEVLGYVEKADVHAGGVQAAHLERFTSGTECCEKSFSDVAFGRRSVREFLDQKVDSTYLLDAINVAAQAPSVCNRQPARVFQFDDKELMQKVLKLQGGWSGYDMPPKLLLVTSDLSAYVFADERNQAFIDGGLFLMNLLLGLENVGFGACPLNTAMSTDQVNQARRLLGIPESHVFIAFVAVGYHDRSAFVPKSMRLDATDIMSN
ncbi:polysaccharide pyruvyl transferase family protein [Halomonas sp. AOP22-C1-8]|uniref:polysaccharide pyruvyl transferase family protein n=1 Tax=Halomonas sp. AOP22-C1-8 TaxID=3457717 RepID=UPI004034CC41